MKNIIIDEYDVSQMQTNDNMPQSRAGNLCGIVCDNGGVCGAICANVTGTYCGGFCPGAGGC